MLETRMSRAASIAEIVSAITIVISLIYVAYEYHRSQTLSSREVDNLLFERTQQANLLVIENQDLAELIVKAVEAPDTLGGASRVRYLAYQHNFFDSWEIAWDAHANGILDDEAWRTWDAWYAQESKRRPRFGWVENSQNFSGDFKAHVDAMLKD